MGCLPLLCQPVGPGTPFATPLLVALDSVRIVIFALGLYVLVKSIGAVYSVRNPHQRAIYLGLAITAFSVLGTEADRLGDDAHYQLLLHVAFAATSTYGLRRIHSWIRDWDDTGDREAPTPHHRRR